MALLLNRWQLIKNEKINPRVLHNHAKHGCDGDYLHYMTTREQVYTQLECLVVYISYITKFRQNSDVVLD